MLWFDDIEVFVSVLYVKKMVVFVCVEVLLGCL